MLFLTCASHSSYVQLYHWYGKGQYDHALKLLDDIGVLPRTQSEVSSKVALFKSTQEVCDIRVSDYELYCPYRLVRLTEVGIADQTLVYSLQGDGLLSATATLLRTAMELLYKLYKQQSVYNTKQVKCVCLVGPLGSA
jgi:hypothetical protein